LKNRALVLLSGEATSIPGAEAKALFLAYDPASRFESPEKRLILVESEADPEIVSSRVAFSRRVGLLLGDPLDASNAVLGKRVRFRSFDLSPGLSPPDPEAWMGGLKADVDLKNPDYEITLVRGRKNYLALTAPGAMRQTWSKRRPRSRAFFHPSAIFPKLSRALVNLSRCKEGQVFLDPFSGTGSIPIEAAEIGARVVASDQVNRMVRGSLANMNHFGQRWEGVIRADAYNHPLRRADAVATDVPYGRASSTRGWGQSDIIAKALASIAPMLNEGSRMVLMHSSQAAVEETPELAVEEELQLYVHRLLTRTITIMRRR
jgi:tRNA G10  N-methylase Trm11